MRVSLHFIWLPVLALWGCGGGEFTSPDQPAGTGGTIGDASAETGGTGGEAGTGGAAGSSTGGTGGPAPCTMPSDCPGENNECTIKICGNNLCQVTFVDAGTPTNAQSTGDCQQLVCDGYGVITPTADNSDLPDDSNPCTTDVCEAGIPNNVKLTPGESCGDGLTCDANGQCTGCTVPQDCGGPDPCFTWTCNSGKCGRELRADGTTCGTCQECKTGMCANVAAGHDPNNECADAPPCGTDGTCNGGGACRFYPSGQPCGTSPECNAGVVVLQDRCDGSGACVDSGTASCAPYRCDENACATTCDGALGCAAGYVCTTNGVCADCLLCGEWYANPTLTTLQACPTDSAALIQTLKDCACGGSGSTNACTNLCAGLQNLCSTVPSPPNAACKSCIEASCKTQYDTCLADQLN